jgi:hypothetical protein
MILAFSPPSQIRFRLPDHEDPLCATVLSAKFPQPCPSCNSPGIIYQIQR